MGCRSQNFQKAPRTRKLEKFCAEAVLDEPSSAREIFHSRCHFDYTFVKTGTVLKGLKEMHKKYLMDRDCLFITSSLQLKQSIVK